MRRRTVSQYSKSETHVYRLELHLQFEEATPAHDARQVARRVTEALRLPTITDGAFPGLKRSMIISHDMKKAIPLYPETPAPGEDSDPSEER